MTVARWRHLAFVLALGATWLSLLLWAAGIDPRVPFTPARTQSLPGSRYHAAFGKAAPDGQQLQVSAAAEDYSALQVTDVPELEAADLPILHYAFAAFPRTLELSLVFRTREAPDDVETVSLPAPGAGTQTFDLSRVAAWRGTIVEVGFSQFPVAQLVPPEGAFRPFAFTGARFESDSWRGRIDAMWSSWFAHAPWQLISVSAIGPAETGDALPHAPRPPLVAALALISLALLAWLVLRRRGDRLARPLLAAAVVAWVGIDAAWMRELDYRRSVDRDIWGAIPFAQRQDHVADAHALAAADRLKNLLASAPANTRVIVNAGTPYEILRLIYFLAPLNATGIGGYANGARSTIQAGSVLVNFQVDRPRPIDYVMRIGLSKVRVKVIDRNEDMVVYRVEASLR